MAHDTEKLRELLERAYLAGFNASGEGWNGEYPYADVNMDPAHDAYWRDMRDNKVCALISQAEGEGAA